MHTVTCTFSSFRQKKSVGLVLHLKLTLVSKHWSMDYICIWNMKWRSNEAKSLSHSAMFIRHATWTDYSSLYNFNRWFKEGTFANEYLSWIVFPFHTEFSKLPYLLINMPDKVACLISLYSHLVLYFWEHNTWSTLSFHRGAISSGLCVNQPCQ